ncbi:AAA family ATPase [Shinella sp. 838]|uniref:ATP-dependent nuclease n=1 Tax=unclassified Shinella TaxID=2643062 RepID=UPI00041A27F3|nr:MULTISPECIES: AAA family ATPase [unclassified Shinella]EYR83736.1 AAA domain containing protein [Shinella sp. DD12]MCA0343596.1 ATP-binding protein [Pseudomonadota bacterium]MDG4670709.1 AAA family ATPase [Shinella sp. 838]
MKIAAVRIKNYRTVKNEINFETPSLVSIVGPNNSGKSNIARALEIFFSGRVQNKYDPRIDLPHGVQREKTSITVSFKPEIEHEWDKHFMELHDQLRNLHEITPEGDGIVSLNLYFNERKPVYQFFGNVKRPKDNAKNAQYSRILGELLDLIFDHFHVYYVPSAKSFSDIFTDFIFPELKTEINPTIVSVVPSVNSILQKTSESINDYLSSAGLSEITADISISESSIDSLVSKIDFMISDNISTELSRKGTGIQAAAIFAGLRWIDGRKRSNGKEVLWIVEEPESYLHPELTRTVNNLIRHLAVNSHVIITTHSLAFVPKNVENILGCEKTSGNTVVSRFSNFNDATYKIRKSIGVKFSDYYSLAKYNIAVEGKTDRSIFESVFNYMKSSGIIADGDFPNFEKAKFITFSGVRDLAEFVRVTYEFVSKECVFVTVLDGDDAGVKYRKDLQGYLSGRKPPVPFESNRHFVSVRSGFPIEGLFPDRLIKAMYSENKSYFSSYSEDAAGLVEPFQFSDNGKTKAQDKLLAELSLSTSVEDFERFLAVFQSIDGAIGELSKVATETIFD